MYGKITADLLGGILKRKEKIPQAAGVGANRVLCLPLVFIKGFDLRDKRQNRAAITACS
jgi:hypothetical protein